MAIPNGYDSSLHMFIDQPRQPDQKRIEFLRWLADHDRLEHPVAGQRSGPLVDQFYPEPDESVVAA